MIGVATRTARIVGVLVVALVAAMPLLSLYMELLPKYLHPAGMSLFYNPYVLGTVLFGTAYAAVGEMFTSVIFALFALRGLEYVFVTRPELAERIFKRELLDALKKKPSLDDESSVDS